MSGLFYLTSIAENSKFSDALGIIDGGLIVSGAIGGCCLWCRLYYFSNMIKMSEFNFFTRHNSFIKFFYWFILYDYFNI
ncbi:hypothetical protein UT300003_26100 [Clostridium sardiniense]